MDNSGNLFGTTYEGGANNVGTVFELAQGNSTITTLASFNGTNGANPFAGLIMDSSGNLYGTTVVGGESNLGTVFELAHGSSTITTLASFNGTNGANPFAGLIVDSSGNLYGTTFHGGASNLGTVFELAHGNGTITTLASFNFDNGARPYAGLIMDSSGNLYGTTFDGGAQGFYGTVFELAHDSGTITTLASFDGINGANPVGGLIMDSSGNLYGTTSQGGAFSNAGTVFELAHGSGTITTLASFEGTNGYSPLAGLIMDSSGNLYGTTSNGGDSAVGNVFELARDSSTITTLASLNGTNGQYPDCRLIMDSNGNLYGTTEAGGAFGYGTVFELQVTDQWTGANFAVDTNWSDGANWFLGAPPTAGQMALFTNNSSVQSFTSTVDAGFRNAIGGLDIDSTWGGTIQVNSSLMVHGNFTMASGNFGGNGAVTTSGATSQWTGGQIDLGKGGFTNSGTLNTDTTNGDLVLMGAGTLTNQGTIDEAGTKVLLLENGATLNNASGATFDLTSDGSVSQSGGGTLVNAGILEKTGGTGTSTVSSSFVNSKAAIAVHTGTLALASAGGTSTGGKFVVFAGALLDLTGGATVAYQGIYTGIGDGTVALGSGTLQAAGKGATFNMGGSLFQWTGGTIDVSNASFTNTGTINYAGSNNVVVTGAGSLINKNSILQTGSGILLLENGATLNNSKGASYVIANNGSIGQSGGGSLVNAGILSIFTLNGTNTITTSSFSNTGTLRVFGILSIAATVTQVSGSTLTAGTWTVVGTSLSPSILSINSAGNLTTIGANATVNLINGGFFTNLTGLTTIQKGGSFSVADQTFTTEGNFSNAGSVTLANGTLNVTGTVAQLSGTSLTGGTWNVGASSNLNFAAGSNITALTGANVTLNGANSNFAALANLASVGSTSSFSLLGGQSFTTAGSFSNAGTLTDGPGSTLTATGSFTQGATARLAVQLGGTSDAPTFGRVVSTTGSVTLDGTLSVTSTVTPVVGSSFEILNNQGNSPISGTFSGLAEGSTFTVKNGSTTMTFRITYVGAGANNVVITRIS